MKCAGCGAEINIGWTALHDGNDVCVCDGCMPMFEVCGEFRTCDSCGGTMVEGFVAYEGAVHLCEGCFGPWMDENCPGGWRANGHDEHRLWDGGYYDEMVDGEWEDTGIYWTEWW